MSLKLMPARIPARSPARNESGSFCRTFPFSALESVLLLWRCVAFLHETPWTFLRCAYLDTQAIFFTSN